MGRGGEYSLRLADNGSQNGRQLPGYRVSMETLLRAVQATKRKEIHTDRVPEVLLGEEEEVDSVFLPQSRSTIFSFYNY